MYHFFARKFNGLWEYRYKLYYQHQVEHATKIYLHMKEGPIKDVGGGKWEASGPNIWQEVTFVTSLPTPESNAYCDPEQAGIKLKLKELNKDIPGWKPI